MPGDNQPDFLYSLRIAPVNSARYWQTTELCSIPALAGVNETFCEVNTQADPYIIQCFGTPTPPTDHYLLHAAPGWEEQNRYPIPVILIHGAGLDANSYTNLWNMGNLGLQQQLVAAGYRVFAVTFPHSHGDNFYHAIQLAAAIDRVCTLCRVSEVDIIAHSKGGIAARLYLSNMIAPGYRGDVRRLIMLGVPNLGTDFAFRNPTVTYMVYLTNGNGVIAWDRLSYLGNHIDISHRSIYKDGAFPGQSQILKRWDDQFPLDVTQQDWWTTYYGGEGFISHSRGIDSAIEDGGCLIDRLEAKGLNPDIELSVLAGTSSLFGLVSLPGPAPGDGVVFSDSALNTDGMTRFGARLIGKNHLPLNHIELLYHTSAGAWVIHQLSQ